MRYTCIHTQDSILRLRYPFALNPHSPNMWDELRHTNLCHIHKRRYILHPFIFNMSTIQFCTPGLDIVKRMRNLLGFQVLYGHSCSVQSQMQEYSLQHFVSLAFAVFTALLNLPTHVLLCKRPTQIRTTKLIDCKRSHSYISTRAGESRLESIVREGIH